jgi:hypothetical protein
MCLLIGSVIGGLSSYNAGDHLAQRAYGGGHVYGEMGQPIIQVIAIV